MRKLFAALLVSLAVSSTAQAAIYRCQASMGGKAGFIHLVDTSTPLEFMWLFHEYPRAKPWCGSAAGSENLFCEIMEAGPDFIKKVHATAEIHAGDRGLKLTAADCGGAACEIQCELTPAPESAGGKK